VAKDDVDRNGELTSRGCYRSLSSPRRKANTCVFLSVPSLRFSPQLLVTFFNLLYLLIVFDVIRNPWFYAFTDVTDTFICKYCCADAFCSFMNPATSS